MTWFGSKKETPLDAGIRLLGELEDRFAWEHALVVDHELGRAIKYAKSEDTPKEDVVAGWGALYINGENKERLKWKVMKHYGVNEDAVIRARYQLDYSDDERSESHYKQIAKPAYQKHKVIYMGAKHAGIGNRRRNW